MITFNQIAFNILTPGQFVEFDSSRAVQGLPVVPHKALIVAPRLAAGAVAALTPTRILSALAGEQACGRGSLGAAMIAAFKKANPYTELWMVGIAEAGGGVAATGTFTVTGPATAAGTLNVYIGGQRIQVAIANGDVQNTIATALGAAINADTSLPVTAGVAANVVTVTARYKGETGNAVDLRLNYNFGDATPAGVAVAIVAMSAGATNPDIDTALAALGDTQYHTVVTPFTDASNLTKLEAELDARWGGMVMKEGHGFAAVAGTHAAISTVVSARNSPLTSMIGVQKSPTAPWVLASVLAAIDANEASNPSSTNRPRQTLVLPGVLPPSEVDRYTRDERQSHLEEGVATFVVDDGGLCRIERVVTTYKTSGGVPDTAYQDIEIMRALAYLRFDVRVLMALRFPRYKLAADGTDIPPGQPVITPKGIRDQLIARFQDWQAVSLVEDIEQFKTDLLVEIDGTDPNRVNAIIPPNVINGLRVFAGQIQFRL